MHLSYSMKFVSLRAKAEADYVHQEKPGAEFWFLGILKLSELEAKDVFRLSAEELKVIDADIAAVRALLQERGVDSRSVRSKLRQRLKREPGSHESSVEVCLGRAAVRAGQRGMERPWAQDVLAELLEHPTDLLAEYLPEVKQQEPPKEEQKPSGEKKPSEPPAPQPEDKPAEPPAEMSRDYLPELTKQVRRMRAKLLSTVQGQDHVVHAFAEGMFAAQVLSAADEKRVRPRAIFAFVGPPGVGKTFLAETAAQALGLPFKRFDMSAYSDHQAHLGLIGFEKSYKDAKEGTLTAFVKEHPNAILLFDEIEKAHLNTIQLFLQILDAGKLADRFLEKDIPFKDTIIIFTSNAGKSLYEGEARQNAAGISRKTLLGALETEKDPRTGNPFFPAAITSRLAMGWTMLFNHLEPHDLEVIARRELERCCGLFERQYGVQAEFDPLLPSALLFREGGGADARTLRAQSELFFKNEVFKVCRLWGEDSFPKVVRKLNRLRFEVETDRLPLEVEPLFFNDERTEVLIYGDPGFAERCRKALPECIFHDTRSREEALRIAGERDISMVLLDISERSLDREGIMATLMEDMDPADLMGSAGLFEFKPMAASAFRDGTAVFRALRERLPELPVYLLETSNLPLDEELTMSYVRAGARGKLTEPGEDFSVLEEELTQISRKLWMQRTAAQLAGQRKVLSFDTAPKRSDDGGEITVRLRDFSLTRAPAAEDAGSLLDEVEKPEVTFRDVIGCRDAKEELTFFIDYLKNPKKFSAQGLKPPKGVLLYGPPGTGKTMLARAMAGESDVAFLPAVASGFVTKYAGSGPEAVRALFQKARRYAPAVVFIDEIDAIGRKRGTLHSGHAEEMALNALLTEMDGFAVDPRRPVFVLAATNFSIEEEQGGIGTLDAALVRRFDRRVLVDLPNEEDREALLSLLLKRQAGHAVTGEMVKRLARRSVGMSPAALTGVLEQAARMAARTGAALDDALLEEAFELTKHGEKKDWGVDYLERVARHESGHALLSFLGGNPPSYLTIVARGDHGGYMEHVPKAHSPLLTRDELLARIRTSLGGRAAEIVYYGEQNGLSTGASGDLQNATRLAAAMLCAYGMDEDFGLAVMGVDEALRDASFRRQVNKILSREMERTVELLRANRPRIDRLVEALLKRNKLTGEEIEAILRQ